MNTHLLLIDDDEDEYQIFLDAVFRLGIPIQCTHAPGAREALDMLGIINPEIIFVDINMPGINGLDCLTLIREVRGFENVFIVAYSNGLDPGNTTIAHRNGATMCLKKPDSLAELVRALENIIETAEQN